jgi:hypothetical protein
MPIVFSNDVNFGHRSHRLIAVQSSGDHADERKLIYWKNSQFRAGFRG